MEACTCICGAQVIIKVLGHQYRWLAGAYDLERVYIVYDTWKNKVAMEAQS